VPATADDIVTDCGVKYVAVAGETAGAGKFIVYTAAATLLTGLTGIPADHARAFSVTL
jgi:hypothetical protein